MFGMLQGAFMLGQGIGYLGAFSPIFEDSRMRCGAKQTTNPCPLAGGMIGDWFGIRRPFEVAFVSFLVSTLFVRASMPYISPDSMSDAKKKVKGIAGFFSPLKVLAPQRIILADGSLRKHLGVLFLCFGVFLGVVRLNQPGFLAGAYFHIIYLFPFLPLCALANKM